MNDDARMTDKVTERPGEAGYIEQEQRIEAMIRKHGRDYEHLSGVEEDQSIEEIMDEVTEYAAERVVAALDESPRAPEGVAGTMGAAENVKQLLRDSAFTLTWTGSKYLVSEPNIDTQEVVALSVALGSLDVLSRAVSPTVKGLDAAGWETTAAAHVAVIEEALAILGEPTTDLIGACERVMASRAVSPGTTTTTDADREWLRNADGEQQCAAYFADIGWPDATMEDGTGDDEDRFLIYVSRDEFNDALDAFVRKSTDQRPPFKSGDHVLVEGWGDVVAEVIALDAAMAIVRALDCEASNTVPIDRLRATDRGTTDG